MGRGMCRRGEAGKKLWTDTRARKDKQTCLNGSNPRQMNAKCDVVMKLSVFGIRTDTHTHALNLYILTTRAVITVQCSSVVPSCRAWS